MQKGQKGTMAKLLCAGMLLIGCAMVGSAQAQDAVPTTSPAASVTSPMPTPDDASPRPTALLADGPPSPLTSVGKVGLVRGVLKRLDPIHDQLLIHAFGGGDIRIAFDPRTQLLAADTSTPLLSLPVGSVVSVDTVIDNGKLFARSVRTGPSNAVELNGQVVRYDAAKSQLILRDPMSPKDLALRITLGTVIVNRGQPAAAQVLSPGVLVRVWFAPAQNAASRVADSVANRVEILAERGNLFSFAGRIVAVDLRSHVLALSNDSDQSVRELAIGSLHADTLGLLREGANVNIQAEFDGEHYNVKTVTVVSPNL